MKVLVVDDDPDFRALIRVLLKRSYPQALVGEYDPSVLGLPRDAFPWADYDVVVLDHELHAEHTGLDWLRRFAQLPGFPAVIFATGAGNENLAARAMKFGADEYLSKRELSAERLGELVSSVMAERAAGEADDDSAGEAPAPASTAAGPVPGYALRRLLGFGGTADVYLAERIEDGLTVVIKVLRDAVIGDELAIRRLVAEAEALEVIDSAHVVRVYGHGMSAGRAFMAMEYLGHGDLRARIAAGIRPDVAVDYALGISRGLATVHDHGLIHRDLKPGNVMFRYDDSLALTDFGIARHTRLGLDLTASGNVVGTPSYISPEQCEGEATDSRSDLYSLGVMFYEMLVGMRPFQGESASALFMQHVNLPAPRLPESLARYQGILDRLLAKRPADRFTDALALARALESLRGS